MAEVRADLWPAPGRAKPVSPVWRSPEFVAELEEWCSSVLLEEVILEEVKVRSWSAVWRVLTPGGTYYAKQNCPGQAFEAGLMLALAGLSDRVVPVTAVDLERGFLMTPDQGPVMREAVGDSEESWCAVVREASLLQREVADYVAPLEAAGARRLGAAEAPTYVATRLEQYAALPAGDPRGLDRDAADRVRAVVPDVGRWSEQVLALGLPVTLNHSDLHSDNVFAHRDGMKFFDFGDAVLSDPLAVLLATLSSMRFHLECGPDDPRLAKVADAAIEVWSDLAPATDLRAALGPALQLGKLARSESWARCLTTVTDEEMAEMGDSAAYWLLDVTEPPPMRTG
ncbi:MAG: phosphotransferase [Nocardioides sp.]